jgi:NCAIR mutase (PurE)-related protein
MFAMLSSCANGVVVVNIDNGFGAAMAVHRIFSRQTEIEL